MQERHFPTLDRLIEQANQTAASKADPVSLLAEVIRVITDEGADPYLVIGVLMEGTVDTVATHIPAERRVQVTEEVRRLLVERLKARGLA